MAVIRWFGDDVFAELDRLSRDFNRVMHGWDNRGGRGTAPYRVGVYPSVNLYDDGESLIVRAEVPGVDPKAIDITVKGDTLTLRGERASDEPSGVSYHRRERSCGEFHRALTLPEQVDADKVMASCREGILEVRLPRAESAKPRKVAVS